MYHIANLFPRPWQPELLRGTLRQNLDPFGEHDDAALNGALRSAGLFNIHSEHGDRANLTLDSEIAGGGSNLSVGQRQIVALARAIVRRSKLLIMDEATSAIGECFIIQMGTAILIQTLSRSRLRN